MFVYVIKLAIDLSCKIPHYVIFFFIIWSEMRLCSDYGHVLRRTVYNLCSM